MKDSPIPSVDNTCAIVITYFPDDEILTRLQRVRHNLPSVIVVDNASDNHCLSTLREFSKSATVKLIENECNEGIAQALNQGISLAAQLGFSWVLTLDQDTLIHEEMFQVLVAIYQSSKCDSPLIGSNYWDVHKKKSYIKEQSCADQGFVEQRTVITAGTLMKVDLFHRIGGFRSDYFIDSVDHEYCLRARANGYVVLLSCKALMSQSVGQPGSRGNLLLTFNHSPVRRYYMARNSLATAIAYFKHEPLWSVRQLIGLSVTLLSIILFEKEKKRKLRAYIRGIFDAINNKMGPCDWAA